MGLLLSTMTIVLSWAFAFGIPAAESSPTVSNLTYSGIDKVLHIARHLGRDSTPIDSKDLGTFTFHCKDAEDACNNACFDIFCRNGPRKFTKKDPSSVLDNRIQSGCRANTNGGKTTSVCTSEPFSKFFTVVDGKPSCDEWPPNSVVQGPFGDPGRHPTSLQCMPETVNMNAGKDLQMFYDGGKGLKKSGRQPKRHGNKRIKPGDTFDVWFDFEGLDPGTVPYCRNQPHKPDNCFSAIQFQMTQLEKQISYPYNYNDDNRYALSNYPSLTKDFKNCQVIVNREKIMDENTFHYTVDLLDNIGKNIGQKSADRGMGNLNAIVVDSEKLGTNISVTPGGDAGYDSLLHFIIEFPGRAITWYSTEPVYEDGPLWCGESGGKGNEIACDFSCFYD